MAGSKLAERRTGIRAPRSCIIFQQAAVGGPEVAEHRAGFRATRNCFAERRFFRAIFQQASMGSPEAAKLACSTFATPNGGGFKFGLNSICGPAIGVA